MTYLEIIHEVGNQFPVDLYLKGTLSETELRNEIGSSRADLVVEFKNQNLKREKSIQENKLLAEQLQKFSNEFDPYEYADLYSEKEPEEVVVCILRDLNNGETDGYISFLQEIIDEKECMSDDYATALELCNKVKSVKKL